MNGFENIKERVELREKFKTETGDNWENSQGEPDIDYVLWLESKLLAIPAVVGRSEQLHLCPVCNEKAGKTYLLSKLPTICQKCDHAWNRA